MCCDMLGAAVAGYPYRHGLFPPITMLQDVMPEDIAPGDERNKNNNHQHGFDVFCRGIVDLVGGPQRQCKGYQINRLPGQFEQ